MAYPADGTRADRWEKLQFVEEGTELALPGKQEGAPDAVVSSEVAQTPAVGAGPTQQGVKRKERSPYFA